MSHSMADEEAGRIIRMRRYASNCRCTSLYGYSDLPNGRRLHWWSRCEHHGGPCFALDDGAGSIKDIMPEDAERIAKAVNDGSAIPTEFAPIRRVYIDDEEN